MLVDETKLIDIYVEEALDDFAEDDLLSDCEVAFMIGYLAA